MKLYIKHAVHAVPRPLELQRSLVPVDARKLKLPGTKNGCAHLLRSRARLRVACFEAHQPALLFKLTPGLGQEADRLQRTRGEVADLHDNVDDGLVDVTLEVVGVPNEVECDLTFTSTIGNSLIKDEQLGPLESHEK